MPRGDKSSYSTKQKRQAEHIEKDYEKKGVPTKTAEARAWATVNKQDGGAKKTATKRPVKKAAAKKTSARKTSAANKTTGRSAAAKKAAATRARRKH